MDDTTDTSTDGEQGEKHSAFLSSKAKADQFASDMANCVSQIVKRFDAMTKQLDNQVQEALSDDDAIRVARCYLTARDAVEEVTAAASTYKDRYTYLCEREYPSVLETSGLKNIPLEDLGYAVGVTVRTKATVKSGQKQEAIEYFRADMSALEGLKGPEGFNVEKTVRGLTLANRKDMLKRLKDVDYSPTPALIDEIANHIQETTKGLDQIVVDHIFPQTLSSLAKAFADEGEELPEDIFTTYLAPTTTRRKL